MGFIKWLYVQYSIYKFEKNIGDISPNYDLYMKNYLRCLEVGFTHEQLLALLNLLEVARDKN